MEILASIYSVKPSFSPQIFATLSEPNGTALPVLLDHVERFIWDLTKHTKCHLKPYIGYEDGDNSHAHLILSVPDDEVARFQERVSTFKPWKSWRFKTLDFQRWVKGHNTFGYVLEKHTPLLPDVACPKRYACCRRGACSHTS